MINSSLLKSYRPNSSQAQHALNHPRCNTELLPACKVFKHFLQVHKLALPSELAEVMRPLTVSMMSKDLTGEKVRDKTAGPLKF